MLVKEYNHAQDFLENYESILLEQEAVSQLVLYSAYHGCQALMDDEPYESQANQSVYGAVLDEDRVILLFCNVIPYNLVVYTPETNHINQACAALAKFLGSRHTVIKGISARHDVCQDFIEEYKKYIRCSFAEKLGIHIMELREVKELTPIEGLHRPALPEEAKLAAQWMIEFQMESLATEMDYEAALDRAEHLIREHKIYFYENEEKKAVTMAAAARKLAHGTAITYIYTPEENRGKGYAAANIYYLVKELLDQGNEFCTLFVDKKNMLSARAYEKVGFVSIGEIYEYKLVPAES